jgi:hypothetical protein
MLTPDQCGVNSVFGSCCSTRDFSQFLVEPSLGSLEVLSLLHLGVLVSLLSSLNYRTTRHPKEGFTLPRAARYFCIISSLYND